MSLGVETSIVWVIIVFSSLFCLCYVLPVMVKFCQQSCARPRNVVVELALVTHQSANCQEDESTADFVLCVDSARVCTTESEDSLASLPVAKDCEGEGEEDVEEEGEEERKLDGELVGRNRRSGSAGARDEGTENDQYCKCAPVAAQNILVMRVWTASGRPNNEQESPTPDPEPEPA